MIPPVSQCSKNLDQITASACNRRDTKLWKSYRASVGASQGPVTRSRIQGGGVSGKEKYARKLKN